MIKIDGAILKQMIISGANNIFNCYPEIDALNVFPVPDGDTGTNMNLTMSSGLNEVAESKDTDIYSVAKSFSRGLLFGARGNSGVILSQIFRGFAEGLKDKSEADALDLAEAFLAGKDVAYKAVIKPVEGTILTVEREAAEALYEIAERGMPIDEALDIFLEEAEASLKRTPNLLPVLKEVGVVDSGGAGFCKIIEGFAKALHNNIVERNMLEAFSDVTQQTQQPMVHMDNVQSHLEHKDFGYCTEFILQIPEDIKKEGKHKFDDNRFKAVLNNYGNSIVAVRDDDLVKVHIHAKKPGIVFNYAQQFGEFLKLKVESMTQQHQHLIDEAKEIDEPVKKETKEFAMVAVCAGDGIAKIFKEEIGVDSIIKGGQTMNPSTEDIVKVIKETNAKTIFVFPNNGNIIMAANTAADVMKDEGVDVIVIPTKTIPEGLVAAMMFNPSEGAEDNKNDMIDAISNVRSGEVTYAIRDTTIGGKTVKKDQFMGMHGKEIACVDDDKVKALYKLIESMFDDDSSIITILCGEDIDDKTRDQVTKTIQNKYGDKADIDIKNGGQPVYSFLISIE